MDLKGKLRSKYSYKTKMWHGGLVFSMYIVFYFNKQIDQKGSFDPLDTDLPTEMAET